MGDNATEIDLDSVIDRLLEGTFTLFATKVMICGFLETSIDPLFRITGGTPSLRTSTYHRVTPPCCGMRLPVPGFKERRKGRKLCLSRAVV